jgi:hypothetical protein
MTYRAEGVDLLVAAWALDKLAIGVGQRSGHLGGCRIDLSATRVDFQVGHDGACPTCEWVFPSIVVEYRCVCGSFKQTAQLDATVTLPNVLEELSLVAESTGLPKNWVMTAYDTLESSVAALDDDLAQAEADLCERRDDYWAYFTES